MCGSATRSKKGGTPGSDAASSWAFLGAVKHADRVRAYFQNAGGSIASMPGLSTCIFGIAD